MSIFERLLVSYAMPAENEVKKYQQSVLEATCPDSVIGPTFQSCMTQWVADNMDHNVRTLDGCGSFHGMGTISASVGLNWGVQHI